MKRPAAVAVHSLAQASTALRAGGGVILVSGRGAGWYAGAAWWLALMAAARAACDGIGFADYLDCADAPGAAMTALRLGQRAVILDATCPAYPSVAAVAATLGAQVMPERPPCLDLSDPHAERELAAWLGSGDSIGSLS